MTNIAPTSGPLRCLPEPRVMTGARCRARVSAVNAHYRKQARCCERGLCVCLERGACGDWLCERSVSAADWFTQI